MTTMTFVTPIDYKEIRNLEFNDYILLYLDKDSKLKRAIPDFKERVISYDDSLIYEAMKSKKIAPFKLVCHYEDDALPLYSIELNDSGEVVNYNNLIGDNINLESYLFSSYKVRNMAKVLKKTR